jgi:4-hydroxy-tetrahydrodipicolinate reductase
MKIALYGYGRMGRTIEQAALQRGHAIALKVDHANAGTPPTGADMAIDFSRPEHALANAALCLRHGVPVVVGTTGWYRQLPDLQALVAANNGAALWASNFSIGVNLFFRLNACLARLMEPQQAYTASITEIHHVHKLDAPSGTAITLANGVLHPEGRYRTWQLQGPDSSTPGAHHLPITSQRTGEVPGTHEVRWDGPEDRITIVHEAFGRQGFANGAVVAAEWLLGRNGLFTMDDVLGPSR